MVSVRLISFGTSAIVTAHSTYFSGGSIVLYIALGITVIADTISIDRHHIAACDPLAADVAAVRRMEIGAFAAGTYAHLLIWRRIQSMPFKDDLRLFKQRSTFHTDQHRSSPSFTLIYRPQ